MNPLIFCLSLLSPHRPEHLVGVYRTHYVVIKEYGAPHCYREIVLVGRTVWEDELVSRVEVDPKFCVE